MVTNSDRISQLLGKLKAESLDVFNLSVIDTEGKVIASTDTDPKRGEHLALLFSDLVSNAFSVSGLTALGKVESVGLKLEEAWIQIFPVTTAHVYIVESKAQSNLGYPTSAWPHLAVPALQAIFGCK